MVAGQRGRPGQIVVNRVEEEPEREAETVPTHLGAMAGKIANPLGFLWDLKTAINKHAQVIILVIFTMTIVDKTDCMVGKLNKFKKDYAKLL